MFEKIKEMFTSSQFEEFDADEQEALLASLIFTKLSDNKITISEDDKIFEIMKDVDWKPTASIESFIGQVTADVRDALGDEEKTKKFLRKQTILISRVDAARRIYEACLKVAEVDKSVVEEEKSFLFDMRVIFGI